MNCGETDLRVLQINHINGEGWKKNNGIYKVHPTTRYHQIANGIYNEAELDVRCANCNILYEYEIGHRKIYELTRPKPKKLWTPDEIYKLKTMLKKGISLKEISNKLDRIYGSVWMKVKELSL